MRALSNYHSHTIWCDGKDRPEDMVLEAIRLGCPELGFSGHSYVDFDDCCMTREGTEGYIREIHALREKYQDRIRIRLGIEQDFYSSMPTAPYEYVIGSVHYLYREGKYLSVDESRESQVAAVQEYYGGDWYAFAEDYFQTMARVHEKTGCQIVGHFDLLTKFNEGDRLFDTGHPRYRQAALEALDRLCWAPVAFEINTGAMARGYRITPYPAPFLLEELQTRKVPLILSSDCHDKRYLLYGLDQFAALPHVELDQILTQNGAD
ncbi:MAG: histidinol-phosphatase [Oscillospiraceae bacterium]|nr:histidinol-phosphatase [Oscillospiraceae bacterium]